MARPRKEAPQAPLVDPPAKKKTVSVIYKPTDRFDPSWVEWNGIRFGANVAVELDAGNPAHYVEQLLPTSKVISDGDVVTTHKPKKMFMGELAKTNWQFEVDGAQSKHLISTRVVPRPGEEWTEEHRGQVIEAAGLDEMIYSDGSDPKTTRIDPRRPPQAAPFLQR